ncbi:MAG: type IV secretory system conjugative DNA transfer family protein [Phycisphaerales bacterium]
MFRLGRRAQALSPNNAMPSAWSLDHPLLHLGKRDAWTTRDACACAQIFGDTGSGKTSGSGQYIARAMLKSGFGGLVLTAKEGETRRWVEYMRDAGREDDLVIFSPEGPHRFNFLEHERTRESRGGGATENLVELFVSAMSAGGVAGSGSQDAFWERAVRQLLRNIIDLLRLAGEPIDIARMHRVITSAPLSDEQIDNEQWRAGSFLRELFERAIDRCASDGDRHDLAATSEYWLKEFASTMDDRTRGNIVSTFTTMADGFKRGTLRELFSTSLTLTPEATFDGKVIVLDLPIKQFHELGVQAQVIWKSCWQRAVESAVRGPESRPVFLWADEAQFFVTPKEPEFLQTAREQKACCVYITQAISNYRNALGPHREAAVQSMLGIAKTKIFHCNGDPDTNEWAQRVISDDWTIHHSHGLSAGDAQKRDEKDRYSLNADARREPRVYAAEFAALRSGGPPHWTVDAILFQSGRRFHATGSNTIRLEFPQSIPPEAARA